MAYADVRSKMVVLLLLIIFYCLCGSAVLSNAVVLFLLIYCCSQCLMGFCVWSLLCYSLLLVNLVLQLGRDSWLLCSNCLPDVSCLVNIKK